MDIKAFAVSDEVVIAQSFLDDAIKSKTSDVSNLNYFKLSQLTGFFDKIQNFKEDEPVETVASDVKVSLLCKTYGIFLWFLAICWPEKKIL